MRATLRRPREFWIAFALAVSLFVLIPLGVAAGGSTAPRYGMPEPVSILLLTGWFQSLLLVALLVFGVSGRFVPRFRQAGDGLLAASGFGLLAGLASCVLTAGSGPR